MNVYKPLAYDMKDERGRWPSEQCALAHLRKWDYACPLSVTL